MAITSGFYNALLVNGVYDRKYNAEDYSANMAAIISNGVLRNGDDGFRVTASGLVLSLSAGRAWISGHWAHNDAAVTVATVQPPVGDYSRIDAVFLRLDTSTAERAMSIVYQQGTAASTPVAPTPTRSGTVYELCLAHITVAPSATTVTVTDKRADTSLCGWVTSPVGYDDYFTALDDAFEDWFADKRDELASVTLFKLYTDRIVIDTSGTTQVVFNIPQYDATAADIIEVYTNGLLEVPSIDYTLSGSTITFLSENGKLAGTEIYVKCYRSIDGTGLGTIADELAALQTQVDALGDLSEYNYICTGVADNVALSNIAQTFLDGSTTDNKKMTVRVYGTLGVSAAHGGAGTSANPYRWFSFGQAASTSRKIIFDFGNCSRIDIACAADTYNTIFYGYNVFIKNCYVQATQATSTTGSIVGVGSTAGKVQVDNCAFVLAGAVNIYAGSTGTWNDCYVMVTNTAGHALGFIATDDCLLRIKGGEIYAYTTGSYVSACVFVGAAGATGVVKTWAVNCPTVSRTGYLQGYAIRDLTSSGLNTYADTVTLLTMLATGQTVTGTAAASKPNRT